MTSINGVLTVTLKDGIPFLMDGTRIVCKVFGDREFAEELANRYNDAIPEVQESEDEEMLNTGTVEVESSDQEVTDDYTELPKEVVEDTPNQEAPVADPDEEEKASE